MKKQLLLVGLILCGTWALAQQGLKGEYFDGKNFERKIMTRTDGNLNFYWENPPAAGMSHGDYSVRWTGQLLPPKSGNYLFFVQVDDGVRVKINNRVVIDAWGMHDNEKVKGQTWLEAGGTYNLTIEYFNGMLEGELHLYWQLPGDEPLLGGMAGYNDKIIEPRFFSQPAPPPAPAPKPATPKPTPVANQPVTPNPKPTTPPKPATPAATPPPAPVAKPVVLTDSIEIFKPKNVLFEQSKSVILAQSKPDLDRLAAFLVRHPHLRVRIEGHTDNLGDPASNQTLSEKRAKRVAEYLAEKGVVASRITHQGFGDKRPLIKSQDGSGNRANRRVVFFIE